MDAKNYFGVDEDFENYIIEKQQEADIEKYDANNETKLMEYLEEKENINSFVALSELDKKKETIQQQYINEMKEKDYLENFTFHHEQLANVVHQVEDLTCDNDPNKEQAEEIDIFKYDKDFNKVGISVFGMLEYLILKGDILIDNNLCYSWREDGKAWEVKDLDFIIMNLQKEKIKREKLYIPTKTVNEIVAQVRKSKDFLVSYKDIKFNDKPVIAFKNGTLDYGKCEFYKDYFCKEDYCSIYIDYDFDINADYTQFDLLMNTLNRQFFEEKDKTKMLNIFALQEMMGLAISKEVCKGLFFVKGQGDSGKTFFLKIIEKILKKTNNVCLIPMQKFSENNRFVNQELINKTVNLGGDLPATKLKESNIKILTGGEMIRAERKGDNNIIIFENICTHIYTCNKMPSNYEDKTSAYYNRMFIIPFDKVIPKEEQIATKDILSEIDRHISEAIAFAVLGLIRCYKNKNEITITKEMEVQKQQYKQSNITLVDFFEEFIDIIDEKEAEKGQVIGFTVDSFYKLYKQWDYNANGSNDYSLKQNNFRDQVEEVYNLTSKRDGRKGQIIKGIRLKEDIAENHLGSEHFQIIRNLRTEKNNDTKEGKEGGAIIKK